MQTIETCTYLCKKGETITVATQATNTAHGVNFNLYGVNGAIQQNQPFTFNVDSSKQEPTILTLVFSFSSHNGGRYDVDLKGSAGGSDQDTVMQDMTPFRSVFYRFFTKMPS